jgi:hypothetical protein
MAVLVRITDHVTQLFHTLYCRLHRRYYNHSVTNGSLTSCVDRSHFPPTVPVGARLFTVGSRLSLPLLPPTTPSALAG